MCRSPKYWGCPALGPAILAADGSRAFRSSARRRFEKRHVGRHVFQARHVVDPRPADRDLPGQSHSQHAAIEIDHRPHVGDNQVDVVNLLEHGKKNGTPAE